MAIISNLMYRYKLLLLFSFCFASLSIFGQQSSKPRRHTFPIRKPDRAYSPNTVIVKFKPQLSKQASGDVKSEFSNLNKNISISGIDRMFPNTDPVPSMKTNKAGKPYVDLSRTYIVHYSSSLSIEEIIDELLKSGKVEYAEPLYVDQVLYVPNDPYADSTSGLSAYYLNAMKYYEALNIEKGDSNVVTGIVDTGADQNHPDLKDNIKVNINDPINGIDDDKDGYIDNYRGWDLGNNDNNTLNPSSDHGCGVSGVAGATPDNNIGMVGTGFKCKFMPIKVATDASGDAIIYGFNGITYAAQHGCKVINLSWGGVGGYSQTAQDVINYAAINYDAVIVAAAGNDALENYYFPASYDNVISVAALGTKYLPALDTTVEIQAYFATYSYAVDVCAQGLAVVGPNESTLGYNTNEIGSSFASPLVAGAAALIRSHYPSYNSQQIAELIRVTADPLIDTVAENIEFKNGKFGSGRINIYRALTDTLTPALRVYSDSIYGKYGMALFGGDTISMVCKFRNFLHATANAHTTISVVSSNASIINGDFNIGMLGTLDSTSNKSNPFKIYLTPSQIVDDIVIIRMDYSDPATGYSGFQYFTFAINPSYIDIDTNQITMTVTSNSRLGYLDCTVPIGDGFIYKSNQLLFEGGLMISNGPTKVADAVRSNPAGTTDSDYVAVTIQRYTKLPEGDQGTFTRFRDQKTADSIGLIVEQRSYAFHNSPNDKFVIIEYSIQNVTGDTLDSLFVGVFNDWDIQNASYNKGAWDPQDSIGYTYAVQPGGLYAGVCLLTNNIPNCFTLDNSNVGGNNINPNIGFSTYQKYVTLSSGMMRSAGGVGIGDDVSQVVSATLLAIPNQQKRTVAFAYVAGDNLKDLQTNARQAKNLFRFYNTSQKPVVSNFSYCKQDTVNVTITPTMGTTFAFYNSPSATTPISTGPSLSLTDISKSDTIYVTGMDSLFESSKVQVTISLFHSTIEASYNYSPQIVNLNVTPNGLANFTSTSQNYTNLSWNMGDGTTTNNQTTFGHNYTTPGTYKIVLTATDSNNCTDTISHLLKVTGTPTAILNQFDQDGLVVYPNPVKDQLIINIQQNSPAPVSIELYNSLGQKIEQVNSNDSALEQTFSIPVSSEEKGMHYAKINLGGKVITRKFVIE